MQNTTESIELVRVQPHPSEMTLKVFIVLISISIWLSLAITVIGLVYVAMIGLFFFVSHLGFIAFIRGNAVRVGAQQLPELYERVCNLAKRAGIAPVPQVYVMQAGGSLNALATKFLRSRMVILYADLLEACGDDDGARDMIIGHELGHIKEGHLDWFWFLLPGYFVPFLGSAYSRAREYTCDKYGFALAGSHDSALHGLAILAAGGKLAPRVNLRALAHQREDMNTGFMTLGKWMATHPPICERILALDPAMAEDLPLSNRGRNRALFAVGCVAACAILVPAAIFSMAAVGYVKQLKESGGLDSLAGQTSETTDQSSMFTIARAEEQVRRDLQTLKLAVEDFRARSGGDLPVAQTGALSQLWRQVRPDEVEPIDPFDGLPYGYSMKADSYILWSGGPDGQGNTEDDIYLEVALEK
jgi:Zn-dependent protease with chaperone function